MTNVWKRVWARKYAPYLSSAFIRTFLSKKSFSRCPNKLFVPEGNLYALYFDEGEFSQLIERFTAYLLKHGIASFARWYEQQFKKYYVWALQMHRTDWHTMSKRDFIGFTRTFDQRFTDFGEVQLLSFVALEGPGRMVEERLATHPERDALLQAIATPQRMTAVAAAHEALVKLVARRKTSYANLASYASRYAWLTMYEFIDQPLRLKDVQRQVGHIRHPREELAYTARVRSANLRRFARYVRAISDQKFKKIVKIAHAFAYLKEMRDDYRRPAYYLQLPFWHEVARRTGLPFVDTNYLTGDEIVRAIQSPKNHFPAVIARRKKIYAFRLKDGSLNVLEGTAALRLAKIHSGPRTTQALRGMAAFPGRVTGTARVVYHQGEFSKFRKGEILVTTMTHPEFVTIMRQAKAVVTDEGGILSHAAIVSRELGIPCIIGTKVATRVFKAGDRVEVDATRGVVRKL